MKKKILYPILAFIIAVVSFSGCVESVNDSSKSSSATPTIEINSPVTGDSVNVGTNKVTYTAADGTGGSGISFYEVYVNGEYVERFDQNDDGTNPDIILKIGSDQLGKRIYYMIKAYNKANKSKESTVQENIYVRDSIPAAPTSLKLTRKSDYVVNLLWNASAITNEDGFEVWRKDGGSGIYTKIKTLGANTISTDDSGISPFTDYYYKVCAFNESGRSEFSSEVCTSNLDGGAWNLQAEAVGASYIKLTWNDFAVNELGFLILRSHSTTIDTFTVSSGNTEYYDYDVSPSTAYTYRVAYWTNSAVSGYSNSATVSTYYTDVDAPSEFSARFNDTTSVVVLSWKDNTTLEKSTIIERKISNNSYKEYITLNANNDDTAKTTDSDIKKGQTYYYRIRQSLGSKIYTPYTTEVKIVIPE